MQQPSFTIPSVHNDRFEYISSLVRTYNIHTHKRVASIIPRVYKSVALIILETLEMLEEKTRVEEYSEELKMFVNVNIDGIHIDLLSHHLPSISFTDLVIHLTYLNDDAYVYSTISPKHFRSTRETEESYLVHESFKYFHTFKY